MSSSSGSSGSSFGTADIVGIVIGGVLGLATIIGLIFSCYAMCGKKNKPSQVWADPVSQYSPYAGYGQPMNTGYYPQPPPQQQPWNRQPYIEQPPPYSSNDPTSNSYGNNKH